MADPQGMVAWQEEKEEVEMKEEKETEEKEEKEEGEEEEKQEENKELLALAVGVGMEMTSFLLKDCAEVTT